MESESKHLDKTEGSYETEYLLRKDIHYRKGEILKLEHINAKHCREIERLNARISTILKSTPDVQEIQTVNCDQINRINELKNMFEYLKVLLINLSRQEGNTPINPDDIDVKYVEAASRYYFPVLFDKYAILDQDDSIKDKIQLADDILHKFVLVEMYEYINLINRGEIDLEFIDHRNDTAQEDPCLLINEDDKHKIELADSILHKFGIETMAKYEELVERGDVDIEFIDRRQSDEELNVLGGLMGGDTGVRT